MSEKRVLPADTFDALELSALVFGGVGGGVSFDDFATLDSPRCILGHAETVMDIPFGISRPDCLPALNYWNPISNQLLEVGIFGSENDVAVSNINRRKGKSDAALWDRVSFAAWCAELGVVRGE